MGIYDMNNDDKHEFEHTLSDLCNIEEILIDIINALEHYHYTESNSNMSYNSNTIIKHIYDNTYSIEDDEIDIMKAIKDHMSDKFIIELISNEDKDTVLNIIDKYAFDDDDDIEYNDDYIDDCHNKIEICSVISECFEKIWFHNYLHLTKNYPHINISEEDKKRAQMIKEFYGSKNLREYSDYELGLLNGQMHALSWVLGNADKKILDI